MKGRIEQGAARQNQCAPADSEQNPGRSRVVGGRAGGRLASAAVAVTVQSQPGDSPGQGSGSGEGEGRSRPESRVS